LNEKEKKEKSRKVVEVDQSRNEIFLTHPDSKKKKQFTFDYTYDENSKQEEVYQMCAFRIVESVLEGYNGTIFAYGQTGTGKTFTMEGQTHVSENRGIIPRTFDQIFKTIDGTADKQFLVSISILELYNEDVFDLLIAKKSKLNLRERPGEGFFVENLSTRDIKSSKECLEVLLMGSKNRTQASTMMNKGMLNSQCLPDPTVFFRLPLKVQRKTNKETL
jgi:kinesin family protein 3/17